MAETEVAENKTGGEVHRLVPMAPVADVERSIHFYRRFGMEVRSTLAPDGKTIVWAHVARQDAELMFTRAAASAVAKTNMIFYLYTSNLVALRASLVANRVEVSEISYPAYMPEGEICLKDPDGYTVYVGQAD